MFGFIRKYKRARVLVQQEAQVRAVVDEVTTSIENLPDLQSLTLQGELNKDQLLTIRGVAVTGSGEFLVKRKEGEEWRVRSPQGKVFANAELGDALIEAVAHEQGGDVMLGKLTDSSFIPEPYHTLAEAEARMEQIRVLDPEGVSNGEYYIDSPEHKVLSGD